jgi:hypothetical protein
MRRSRWPLGIGNHTRSVVHTFVAGGIGVFALFLAMMMATAEGMSNYHSLRIAASCRTWALLMLAALSCEGAVLYLLRPGVIRLLTPTPLKLDRLCRVLDPARGLPLIVLPYALAALAGLSRWHDLGPWSSAAWVFFVAMLFRTLVPIFALIGVLLRKLVLPAGHWIVWGVAVASVIGSYGRTSWTGADGITLAGLRPAWLWLPIGIAFIPLGSLAAWACRRIALAAISREELVEYAFPVEIPAPPKSRSMLVEIFSQRGRLRRAVYLAQEAFGLHRVMDWGKAVAVWAIAFGVTLYAVSGFGGSGAHVLLTAVPTLVFLVWNLLRMLRMVNGKLVAGVPSYALPVGYLEKVFAQLAVFTCVFLVSGALAALSVYLVWTPTADVFDRLLSGLPSFGVVRASVENLAQLWMLLAAVWVCFSTFAATRAARKKFDLTLAGLPDSVIGWVLYLGTFMTLWAFFVSALAFDEAWVPILAVGGRRLLSFAFTLCFASELPLAFHLFPDISMQGIFPLWPFEVLAWSLPALVLTYFLLVLRRIGRGKAHPSHKALFPVAWALGKTA